MKRFSSFLLITGLFALSCNGGNEAEDERAADLEVVAVLQQKLQLVPDSLGIRYQLMNALSKVQDYTNALLQNDTLLMDDSANAPVLYRRGAILLESGDTSAAITALRSSSAAAPMFSEPLLQLAAIYANRGNAEAIQIADTLIRGSQEIRTTSQARFIKGLYYSNINDNAAAIAAFDECIQNDYTFLEAYIEKGLLLYDEKKYREALAVFERVIQVSNTFAEAYYQSGRCHEALGNTTEAKEYYQKAYGLDKTFTAARDAFKGL